MSFDPDNCVYCIAQFPHEPTDLCKDFKDESLTIMSNEETEELIRSVGRPQKDASEMTDARSSGRKRAAEIAIINPGDKCEWALLKEAGGGIAPIIGCTGNPAQHRHHGPDKNTLNNTLGSNLHRICTYCHNRWHAENDKYYSGERPKDDTPWLPDPIHGVSNPHNPNDKLSRKEVLIQEIARS